MVRYAAVGIVFLLSSGVTAQEKIIYKYDALGRLIGSTSTSQNNPIETTIEYDDAGNRKRYQVSGSPNGGGDIDGGASIPVVKRFVIVPLNGFTIIPLE